MSKQHDDDELPSLALTDLANVTGGAGFDMSMMMMMMMMRGRSQAAAPAPAPAPEAPAWRPRILVDGVEQQLTASADGTSFTTST